MTQAILSTVLPSQASLDSNQPQVQPTISYRLCINTAFAAIMTICPNQHRNLSPHFDKGSQGNGTAQQANNATHPHGILRNWRCAECPQQLDLSAATIQELCKNPNADYSAYHDGLGDHFIMPQHHGCTAMTPHNHQVRP